MRIFLVLLLIISARKRSIGSVISDFGKTKAKEYPEALIGLKAMYQFSPAFVNDSKPIKYRDEIIF